MNANLMENNQVETPKRKRALEMPSVRDWPEAKRKRKVNEELYALGYNRYYANIPTEEICAILTRFGFSDSCMEGIYTGHEGRMNERVVGTLYYLVMTWYRMGSGRFEIVAYLS